MNHSTPSEDGEPTSSVQTAKKWYQKHKPKIDVIGGVTLGAALVVIAYLLEAHDADRYEPDEAAHSEPVSGRGGTGEPRQSPTPHLRRLAPGRNASEEKRAEYKARTGDDLAPGTTWVDGGSGASPEDEATGEAPA
ncbi:hypothetical protein [Kitasatospora sp. NPDC089509]|uniref:hypothetical protein n=1 Tax=Kitasatospora sp. NPDC089509 TaxID=3364079 RepID=UPI0037F6A743